MREVRALNTSASGGSFVRSTVIGPTCRHSMAKRDRSSATPIVPFIPPVRACERWQVTPGTFGSSKALTQILSFAPRMRNVVETQPMSSASRRPTTPPSSTTKTNPTLRSLRIPSPPHIYGQRLLQPSPSLFRRCLTLLKLRHDMRYPFTIVGTVHPLMDELLFLCLVERITRGEKPCTGL